MGDPDLELIEATGRGDQEAFEALVVRYQNPLLNFITRYLRDRTLAEDVAQEVFLRIYRAAPRFEPKAKVSTWIFQIAYNLALTEMGHRKRRRDLCEAIGRYREETDQSGKRYELEEAVTAALGRLPEQQRAALLLRINEGLSYQEIGDILGTSVSGVESLLFRGRKALKLILKEHEGANG
jgi:RNA polymerase sigma-70 factor (ECF subfamily)